MRKTLLIIAVGMVLGVLASAQPPTAPPTMAQVLNRRLTGVESEFVSAADAMPADKYSFAPTNGEFKGVRTFAEQVKHVAQTNWEVGGAILGEKPPADIGGPDENGPPALKSKAEIMKYLTDSFAYLHKAIDTIDANNATAWIKSSSPSGKTTRLSEAMEGYGHPYDHYGQMVEYLRMNGIIPPASRPRPLR